MRLTIWLADQLTTLVLAALATTVGVLVFTHPAGLGIHCGGVPLDAFAIMISFVVYGILDDIVNRIWDRFVPELDEADV